MLTQAENAPDQKKFWRYVVLGCRPCKLRKADNRRHALLYAAITDAPYFVFKGSSLFRLIARATNLR